MFRKTLVAAALFALSSLPAAAAGPAFLAPIDDETVTGLAGIARLLLPQARLPDGKAVPPESEAERKAPLLDPARTRRVVEAGQLSAVGDWCGLEWDALVRSPAMKATQADRKLSPKQIAYAGVLHDTAMGAWQSELARSGDCGPKDKATVQNLLNRFKF